MSQEPLIVPKSKEVLNKQDNVGNAKGMQELIEGTLSGQSWNNLRNKINKLILYYDTECKNKYP